MFRRNAGKISVHYQFEILKENIQIHILLTDIQVL